MMEQKQYELAAQVLREVQKVILGKREIVEKVLMAVLAQGHVLLDDVPGVGKTTLAMAFARALGLETRRVQFTPDTMPSDILGFSVYDKQAGAFSYQPGAVMTNLLLADEINRTSTKTQAALLEAMEERRVTVDGKTHPLPQPFFVLATQNPVGSAGTQLLPPAQLDRFLLCLSMGYPDRESQVELMKERHHADPLAQVRPVTDAAALGGLMDAAAMTFVADPVYDYTARLLEVTRCHESLQLGLSPRAGLALCRAAKARAFLHARDYVLPEDVAEAAPDVCAHRLVLAPRARLHDETARSVLAEILERVPQRCANSKADAEANAARLAAVAAGGGLLCAGLHLYPCRGGAGRALRAGAGGAGGIHRAAVQQAARAFAPAPGRWAEGRHDRGRDRGLQPRARPRPVPHRGAQ